MLELLLDNRSVQGRLVTTVTIIIVAVVLSLIGRRVVARRAQDSLTRYYARKGLTYLLGFVALIALAIVWRPFAGRIGVILGVMAAGVAFAMQEVIGAVAGWFNILSGRIFRVGDRIEMGGVRGDVIDITPLRTKILEMGSGQAAEQDRETWVAGRQYTGRIVAVSNKATFTEPVFNYSAAFDYIWEEMHIPIAHGDDWREAERIVLDEVRKASGSEAARQAIDHMAHRYPVPRTEVEPRVYVRATDNWMELAARFVVPVRTARSVKDEVTRRIIQRLDEQEIAIASETLDASLRFQEEERSPQRGSDRPSS